MRSILEELFYGNVCPNTDCRSQEKETKELIGYLADHHDTLIPARGFLYCPHNLVQFSRTGGGYLDSQTKNALFGLRKKRFFRSYLVSFYLKANQRLNFSGFPGSPSSSSS